MDINGDVAFSGNISAANFPSTGGQISGAQMDVVSGAVFSPYWPVVITGSPLGSGNFDVVHGLPAGSYTAWAVSADINNDVAFIQLSDNQDANNFRIYAKDVTGAFSTTGRVHVYIMQL